MSSSLSKTVSLVGAIFCFAVFLLSVILYFGSIAVQVGFATTGERQIVGSMFWFGSAFLIVFGILLLRDYYRS